MSANSRQKIEAKQVADIVKQVATIEKVSGEVLAFISEAAGKQYEIPLKNDGQNVIVKGQSAGGSNGSGAGMPINVGRVDYGDNKAVRERLSAFETRVKNADIEHNITITADGNVWETKGGIANVDSSRIEKIEGGSSLKNSISYHNHPLNSTHFSFSGADTAFFLENRELLARSSDYKYWYEMERTSETLSVSYEEAMSAFKKIHNTDILEKSFVAEQNGEVYDIDEDGYHDVMKILSKKYEFKYKREAV